MINDQIISERKVSRETILRDKVKIRLALDECGQQIAVILAENGVVIPGCDWSRIFPSWLIATVGNDIIGCIQVMPAKPVGYCEFLFTKPGISFKLRAIAIRQLIEQGIATVRLAGASYCACTVHSENAKFLGVLEKMNITKLHDGSVMVKRLVA